MMERFTERSKKVLRLAREEAGRLNHEYIGTEHILLGLLAEGKGVAAAVLKNLAGSLERVRTAVEAVVQSGPPGTELPERMLLTPRAKRTLDAAGETARQWGHNYVGTEHLLAGLLREGEGVAARVLAGLGLRPERVHQAIFEALGLSKAGQAAEKTPPPADTEDDEEEPEDEEETAARRPLPQREIPWPDWVKEAVNAPEILALERRLAEAQAAKQAAVERQDFEAAAQRRDEERAWRERLPRLASLRAVRALLDRPTHPACEALRNAGLDLDAARQAIDALLRDGDREP